MKKLLNVVLSLLVLLLLAAFVYFQFFFKNQLKDKISEELKATFGNYYQLIYDDIQFDFDWESVSISLFQVDLKSDTTSNSQNFLPVFFNAQSLKISNFKVLKLWFDQKIEFGQLELLKPKLQLFPISKKEDKAISNKKSNSLNLTFEELKIDSASFTYYTDLSVKDTLFNADLFSLKMNAISFVQLPDLAIHKGINWDSLKLSFQKIDFHPTYLPYSLKIDQINYSSNDDIFELNKCSFYPNKSLKNLAKQEKYQKVFSEVFIPSIEISGFKSESLRNDKVLLNKLKINEAEIVLLKDKNKPINPLIEKMDLQYYLNKIKYHVQIDSVLIKNASINTLLINKGEIKPISILVNKLNGSISDFKSGGNDSAKLVLKAEGVFLGLAKIWIAAEFPLRSHLHSYTININGFDFEKLNPLINHFYPLEVKSGSVKSITMFGVCDDKHNNGFIDFEYENLDLKIYKKRNGILKQARLLSFVANQAVIDSNPRKGKKLNRYKFRFDKKKFQGPIMLWIGGLAEGIKESVLSEKVKRIIEKH